MSGFKVGDRVTINGRDGYLITGVTTDGVNVQHASSPALGFVTFAGITIELDDDPSKDPAGTIRERDGHKFVLTSGPDPQSWVDPHVDYLVGHRWFSHEEMKGSRVVGHV